MISFDEFIQWLPDTVSEDRVNLVILEAVRSGNWALVYSNPPSGSWKGLSIYRFGYEYRQVGPKRGVTRMKRPDIAFQDLQSNPDRPRFLLFENKSSRRGWDYQLPRLLQEYFEHPDEGVKRLPFDHRRQIDEGIWEKLEDAEPARVWFSKTNPTYLFGFAYGPVPVRDLAKERDWIEAQMTKLSEGQFAEKNTSPPPLVMVAVSFAPESLKPRLVWDYSSSFPDDVRSYLNRMFTLGMVEDKT